jgi:hypothetical protein
MTEPTDLDVTPTDPPPSPTAKALRAIGANLDTLGDLIVENSGRLAALQEMGEADSHVLRRVEGKVDRLLLLLEQRVGDLETWRGAHERAHVTA